MLNLKRIPVREQPADVRRGNNEEVCLGYNQDEATQEAVRCLGCKKPRCVEGCPVGIDIPGFIAKVKQGDVAGAAAVIARDSALPASRSRCSVPTIPSASCSHLCCLARWRQAR